MLITLGNTMKEVILKMGWGTNKYRFSGRYVSGYPKKVEAWCGVLKEWCHCPTISVALRIKALPHV